MEEKRREDEGIEEIVITLKKEDLDRLLSIIRKHKEKYEVPSL